MIKNFRIWWESQPSFARLAKRVVADGEGASKFVTINQITVLMKTMQKLVFHCKLTLVKTAIAGEDPNCMIIMAIGNYIDLDLSKLSIKLRA